MHNKINEKKSEVNVCDRLKNRMKEMEFTFKKIQTKTIA